MTEKFEMDEEVKRLVDTSFIELAGKLFLGTIINSDGQIDKKPLPVRFIQGELAIIIILNNQASLWFTQRDGKLEYDGWEFGDYNGWGEGKEIIPIHK